MCEIQIYRCLCLRCHACVNSYIRCLFFVCFVSSLLFVAPRLHHAIITHGLFPFYFPLFDSDLSLRFTINALILLHDYTMLHYYALVSLFSLAFLSWFFFVLLLFCFLFFCFFVFLFFCFFVFLFFCFFVVLLCIYILRVLQLCASHYTCLFTARKYNASLVLYVIFVFHLDYLAVLHCFIDLLFVGFLWY